MQDDVYLSYLPLAHIFDRVVEELFISIGASIGYWRGVSENHKYHYTKTIYQSFVILNFLS